MAGVEEMTAANASKEPAIQRFMIALLLRRPSGGK